MRIVRCGTDICQFGLFDVLMFVGEIGLDLRLNFTVWVCGDFSLRLIGLVIIFAGQKSRQGLYLVVTCYPRAAFRLRSMTGPGLMYCRPLRLPARCAFPPVAHTGGRAGAQCGAFRARLLDARLVGFAVEGLCVLALVGRGCRWAWWQMGLVACFLILGGA